MHPIVMAVELFLDQHSPKQFCKMSATNTQFLEAHWKKYVFWITHVILKLITTTKENPIKASSNLDLQNSQVNKRWKTFG